MAKKRGLKNKFLIVAIVLLVIAVGLLSVSNSSMASITGNSIFNFDTLFSLLKNPIRMTGFVAYDSACVSDTLPATMAPGESRSVSVTIKNLGTNLWLAAYYHKLGSTNPNDNMIWGLNRFPIASGIAISTNQQYTFTFPIKAPTTPGTYSSRWRMVKTNTSPLLWFGATCGRDIVIQVPAVCTPGQTESQACGTDTGECQKGTQTRTCSSTGQWGAWGACNGAINPVAETCNAKDDDCDGLIDENFDLDGDGFATCCPQ